MRNDLKKIYKNLPRDTDDYLGKLCPTWLTLPKPGTKQTSDINQGNQEWDGS